jgi:uncharacterized protein YaaQ
MSTHTINRLMIAVVQEQDVEMAVRALKKLKISVTRLPSSGGFLGRRSTTLMLGIEAEMESAALKALHKSCRTRIEYITMPLEGTPMALPAPTPVSVGGATVFMFDIERYEVI